MMSIFHKPHMAILSSHGPDPCSGNIPVAPGVTVGGVVALVPHPEGIIITRDVIEDFTTSIPD